MNGRKRDEDVVVGGAFIELKWPIIVSTSCRLSLMEKEERCIRNKSRESFRCMMFAVLSVGSSVCRTDLRSFGDKLIYKKYELMYVSICMTILTCERIVEEKRKRDSC